MAVSGLREGFCFAMFVVHGKLNEHLVSVNNEMSPRRRKAEDADVFAALVRSDQPCRLLPAAPAGPCDLATGPTVQLERWRVQR